MEPRLNPGLPPPFDELIQRHEREIMRYIVRATGDRDDALDVFQETWLRAYRAYPKLNSVDGFRPWLFRIATNLCLNRRRDRMRRARVIAETELQDTDAASLPVQDAAIQLKSMIARLPPKQREAFIMRKLGGLDYCEIAAALECSEEAARAGVYQALKKLKCSELAT